MSGTYAHPVHYAERPENWDGTWPPEAVSDADPR